MVVVSVLPMNDTTTTTCTTRPEDGWVICTDADGVLILDDDPRFDCTTMGNLICGPVAPVEVADALVIERPAPATELARTGAEGSLAVVGLAMIIVGRFFVRLATRRCA